MLFYSKEQRAVQNEWIEKFSQSRKTHRMKGDRISGDLTKCCLCNPGQRGKRLNGTDVELCGNQRAEESDHCI